MEQFANIRSGCGGSSPASRLFHLSGGHAAPATRNGGGGRGNGDYGTLYGHKITQQDYINARNEFYMFYWLRNNEWPDRNPNIKNEDLEEQIYLRLMLTQKARAPGHLCQR